MINGKVRKKPLISTQTEKHLTTVLTAAARVQIKSAGSGSLGIARRVFLPRSQCAADRSVEIPPKHTEIDARRRRQCPRGGGRFRRIWNKIGRNIWMFLRTITVNAQTGKKKKKNYIGMEMN